MQPVATDSSSKRQQIKVPYTYPFLTDSDCVFACVCVCVRKGGHEIEIDYDPGWQKKTKMYAVKFSRSIRPNK